MCVSYSKYVKLEVAEVKESALAADVDRDDRESDCAECLAPACISSCVSLYGNGSAGSELKFRPYSVMEVGVACLLG